MLVLVIGLLHHVFTRRKISLQPDLRYTTKESERILTITSSISVIFALCNGFTTMLRILYCLRSCCRREPVSLKSHVPSCRKFNSDGCGKCSKAVIDQLDGRYEGRKTVESYLTRQGKEGLGD